LTNKDGSKRQIIITDKTMELVKEAYDQEIYEKNNGESTNLKGRTLIFNKSKFIIKAGGKNRKEKAITEVGLSRRVMVIKDLRDNKYLNITNIWYSGMINYAHQLKDNTQLLTKEDFFTMAKKFGFKEENWSGIKRRISKYL
jgi:hypothetical protein